MNQLLFRVTSLVFAFVALNGCGEDPLGYDDDEDANQSATENSGDATGIQGTPQDSTGVSAGAGAVTGKINGKDWTYVSGSARSSTYSGKTTLYIRLIAATGGEASCPSDDVKRAWVEGGYLKVNKHTGSATNDNYVSADMYFYDAKTDEDDSEYAYDDEVALEITEQTATKVAGSLKITAGNSNAVSGTFSVPFCDD